MEPEMMEESDTKSRNDLDKLFTICFIEEDWQRAFVILIYEIGDPKISFLPQNINFP